jgi:hypothetical protein
LLIFIPSSFFSGLLNLWHFDPPSDLVYDDRTTKKPESPPSEMYRSPALRGMSAGAQAISIQTNRQPHARRYAACRVGFGAHENRTTTRDRHDPVMPPRLSWMDRIFAYYAMYQAQYLI